MQQQTGPSSEEALAALKAGQTDKAEALFISIAKERQKTGSKAYTEAAEAWRHVGALAFLHDTQKALVAYAKAVELDPDNADGWNQLATLQMRIGKLDAAEKSYLKVLSLGNWAADKSVIGAATGNLGLIHQTRGDLDKAEEMHLEALELSNELGRKESMASTYSNFGVIHKTRGDPDKAEETHLKSLELEKELGRKEGMANQYGNLGVIHQTRGDPDQACQNWHKARELFADIGMPHMVEKVEAQMKEAGCAQK